VSWNKVSLGDVCTIINGGTPKSEVADYWEGDLNWITPKEMGKLLGREIASTERKITEKGLKNSSAKLLPINSVILSSRAPIGHLAINKELMATNQGCKGLIPSSKLNYEYLYYFLYHSKKLLNDMGSGATFKELSASKLATVQIPLPPIAIQEKLVKKLDAIFAEIDKVIEKSVINSNNAEALFHSYLTEVFERGGNDWITTVLDKVCKVDRGCSPRPIKNYFTDSEDGVNWIKIGDTEEGGKYIFSTNQKITKAGAEKSRYVDVGDFILTNSMSYGRPYIMRTNGYIHDGWFVLRLNENIDAEYFYYLLNSPYVQNQFKSLAAGSVVKNISGDLVKKTVLPIPKIEEQRKLAETFTEKQIVLKRLAEVYLEKEKEMTLLKSSVLQQAFNGELITE